MGRNGGQKLKNNFFCRIHLRQLSEPVVLDTLTFVTAFSKVSQLRKQFRGRRENLSFWRISDRSKRSDFDRSNLHPINGPYGKFGHIHVEELGQTFATHPSN